MTLPGGVDLGRLDLSMDWRVLVAAFAITLMTLAFDAALPIARFTRARLAKELIGSSSTASASSQRLRQSLLTLTPGHLVWRGVAAGLTPVAAGVVVGLFSAAMVARVFVSALPGLGTLDPVTYASVGTLMLGSATAAALTAAWRLRRVAPAEALRAEQEGMATRDVGLTQHNGIVYFHHAYQAGADLPGYRSSGAY